MHVNLEAQLRTVDRSKLTPLVRRALGRESAVLSEWRLGSVHGGAGDLGAGTSGVYRLIGRARDQDQELPWSLILKICNSSIGSEDPTAWDYWKRELRVYQSGLLNDVPGGLVAANCYGVDEEGDDVFCLWLEDISDTAGASWQLQRYSLAARHLGQFNGAWATGRPLPDEPWFGRGWLASLMTYAAPAIGRLEAYQDHPLVRRHLTPSVVERILRLWSQRFLLLSALDDLPHAFCHRDAFRRNLFARDQGGGEQQTVAVDWAYAGVGAIGTEIAPLIAASLVFFEVDLDDADQLEQVVTEGYLQGLHDAGWRGDPEVVTQAYAATAALMYCVGYMDIGILLEESRRVWSEQMFGRPFAEVWSDWAAFMEWQLDRADSVFGVG